MRRFFHQCKGSGNLSWFCIIRISIFIFLLTFQNWVMNELPPTQPLAQAAMKGHGHHQGRGPGECRRIGSAVLAAANEPSTTSK